MTTPSKCRLRKVTVGAFRGYRDEAEFDLDGTAVLFSGPNGTGKTGVFDALQWLMLGSIKRLEGLRARKNEEHIVNTYHAGGRAHVRLDVMLGEREVAIQRRGNYAESTLEISGLEGRSLFGTQAEEWLGRALIPRAPKALDVVLLTCGLLQQDAMRFVLEAKASERYAHFTAILGLEGLDSFEREAQESAKEAEARSRLAEQQSEKARQRFEYAASRVETVREGAFQQASVTVARLFLRNAVEEMSERIQVDVPEMARADETLELAQRCRLLRDQVRDLLEEAGAVGRDKEGLDSEPSRERLQELKSAFDEASRSVAEAKTVHRDKQAAFAATERTAKEILRLAAAAIPRLSRECPVCGQRIDPVQVEKRLQEVAGDTSALMEARESVGAAARTVDRARERRIALEREYLEAIGLVEAWQRLRKRQNDIKAATAGLGGRAGGDSGLRVVTLGSIERWGPETLRFLERLVAALERYSDVVARATVAGEIKRAESEIEHARAVLEERLKTARDLSKHATSLKQLTAAARWAKIDVTKARFAAIEPLVADIYARLDPHPAFKEIRFSHELYYGKGTSRPIVSDVSAGVDADPLVVFSASQANIAALSCFLSMSLGAGERALPFVLLDDPLQAMDDVNVLGFADLCRFLRTERQVLLSTHDRRFANLLARKLAPRESEDVTVVHRFGGWDRSGPVVETERITYQREPGTLKLLDKTA